MGGGEGWGWILRERGGGKEQLIKNRIVESLRELTANSTNSQRTPKEGSRILRSVRKSQFLNTIQGIIKEIKMAIKKSELYGSLWKSCDELRGGMDASQYKDYVLVLLFVKYVSDR